MADEAATSMATTAKDTLERRRDHFSIASDGRLVTQMSEAWRKDVRQERIPALAP